MNRFVQILKWMGIILIAFVALTAAVVYGLSEYELTRTYNDKVPLTAIAVPHDDASIAEGKRLVGVYHCGSCHAKNYEGQAFFKVDMLATLIAPNLTTSIPTCSDSELARIVRHAVKKDGSNAWMFSSGMYTAITDADMGKMPDHMAKHGPKE